MSLSIFPYAFENSSIYISILSLSILFTINKVTLILWTIFICINAMTMHCPIFPHSSIGVTPEKNCLSIMIYFVIFKNTFIFKFFINVFSISLLLPIQEITLIINTISPFLFSWSMWDILCPISFICIVSMMIDKLSLSVSLAAYNLTLIVCPININQSAFLIWSTLIKNTLIDRPIRKIHHTFSMRHIIFPLPHIDSTFFIK